MNSKQFTHGAFLIGLVLCGAAESRAQVVTVTEGPPGQSGTSSSCPLTVSQGSTTTSYQLRSPCGALIGASFVKNENISGTSSALLTEALVLNNQGSSTKQYTVSVHLPLANGSLESLLVNGQLTLKLATDSNGGSIAAVPGTSGIFQLLSDTDPVEDGFAWAPPSQITNSGAGESSTTYFLGMNAGTYFGGPILPAPSAQFTIGTTHTFILTSGDTATISATILATGVQNQCPADLDSDGVVSSSDLGILFGGWNQPGSTDLNGDGTTNGIDMSMLLNAFGPC